MASTTVRISEAASRTLRELASRASKPMQRILDEAIEAYRRQCFLRDANKAYAALRSDPTAWEAEQEERGEWDATLADGLEEE